MVMDGIISESGEHLTGVITTEPATINGSIAPGSQTLSASVYKGIVRPFNYNDLINKPQIESVELAGNKSLEDIGIDRLSNADLARILD